MSTEEKYSCIEKRTTIRDYIRNQSAFKAPDGFIFHCFMAGGVEFSGITNIGEYYVKVTTLWPYSEKKLALHREITIVYTEKPIPKQIAPLETQEEVFSRLAPEQHTNLVGRYDITRDK